MKKQSFSLLVDSIRDNNFDSLLQLLVNARIRVVSKLVKKAVIMVEADKVVSSFHPTILQSESIPYKYVARRESERLNKDVTENTVRYYLGIM